MGKFSYWGVVVYVDGMPGQYKARIWVEASPDGEGVIVRVRSYHHNLPAITEMKDAVMALMTKKARLSTNQHERCAQAGRNQEINKGPVGPLSYCASVTPATARISRAAASYFS